uniref:Protein ORF4 n=2 Tax=Hepatitis E virus TaxID=1678143 RepID=ORF4_HEVPA|nr:RecName: Full=Protein ORF4 [Hepatitis E virus (strain Pakistan)]AMO00782.1 ORF4 [Hepatitis E virus]AMO00783.1 ORF4 [Hepatitis E virus]AMO00784.1 ORF4 [Hepatitis E virus]AMO00785.1 ORF4 [Hepatitis E virus]
MLRGQQIWLSNLTQPQTSAGPVPAVESPPALCSTSLPQVCLDPASPALLPKPTWTLSWSRPGSCVMPGAAAASLLSPRTLRLESPRGAGLSLMRPRPFPLICCCSTCSGPPPSTFLATRIRSQPSILSTPGSFPPSGPIWPPPPGGMLPIAALRMYVS